MVKNFNPVIGLLGLAVAFYAILSAILYSNQLWLSSFVVGGSLFLGYLNYQLNNESILTTWEKDKRQLLVSYVVYLFATLLIEFVGRLVLRLWDYPSLGMGELLFHVFLVQYPIGFFYLYESFVLVRSRAKPFSVALLVSSIATAFLVEIPNTTAPEWKYNIPFVTLQILQVNVVVVLGWVILTSVPIVAKKLPLLSNPQH